MFAQKVGKYPWDAEGIVTMKEDQDMQEELNDHEDWHIRSGMRLDFLV